MRITERQLRQIIRGTALQPINEARDYAGALPAGLSVDDISFFFLLYETDTRGWLYSPSTNGLQTPMNAIGKINQVAQNKLMPVECTGAFNLVVDITNSVNRMRTRGGVPRADQVKKFLISLSGGLDESERKGIDEMIKFIDLLSGYFFEIVYDVAIESIAPVGFSDTIDKKRGGPYFTWGSWNHTSNLEMFWSSVNILSGFANRMQDARDFIELTAELMDIMPLIDSDYVDSIARLASSGLDGMRQAVEIARSLTL